MANLKCIAVLLLTFLIVGIASGQEKTEFEPFVGSVKASSLRILPFEPINIVFILKNATGQRQNLTSSFDSVLSYRKLGDKSWTEYESLRPLITPAVDSTKVFSPGVQWSGAFDLFIDVFKRPVFGDPGVYEVKGAVFDLGRNTLIESPPIRIVVQSPMQEDAKAFFFLKTTPLYRYFTQATADSYLETAKPPDPQPAIRRFIRQFPNSSYSQWASLSLALIRQQQAGMDLSALKSVQNDLETLATKLKPPVNANAWYQAGQIATLRADRTAAKADFQKAVSSGGDSIIALRIRPLITDEAPASLWNSSDTFGQGADTDKEIASALALAKKNDLSAIYSLCEKNGPRILPAFQKYISDESPDVRRAVETAAALISSPDSQTMLLQLMCDQETDIADHALEDFIRIYPLKTLNKPDALICNEALLVRLQRGDASGLSLLLLANYAQTPETIALLNSLRKTNTGKVGLKNSLPVQISNVVDVTLAELDDKAAGERVAAIIHGGPVASIVDVAAAIPYMADPRLLLQATELLKDTRPTDRIRGGIGQVGPGTPVLPVEYHRVCDFALIKFAIREPSATNIDVSVENSRQFTQDELNESYKSLQLFYGSLVKTKLQQ